MIDLTTGIIGNGVVGQATGRSYLEHVKEVRCFDVLAERRTHSWEDTLRSDIVFICLPTPQRQNSLECDTDYLEDFFVQAAAFHPDAHYVIRSTVPIGFTSKMREKYNLPNLC